MGMGQEMLAEMMAEQGSTDAIEHEASEWMNKAHQEDMIANELGCMGFSRAQTDALHRRNACLSIAKKILEGKML